MKSTKSNALALLAMLLVAAIAGPAAALSYTYIANDSTRAITATTSYPGGVGYPASQFQNRVIAPGTSQSDQYDGFFVQNVHIEIWVEGSGVHNSVDVAGDHGIVGYNNADGSGVDIYNAKYGTINTPEGGVLITIFP